LKKIIGLLSAVALVMAMVGGGTWAYFADTETSADNSLASGTLDLTIDGGNVVVTTFSESTVGAGDSGSGSSVLANVGSLGGCLSLEFSAITNTGGVSGEYSDGSGDLGAVAELAVYLDVDQNSVFDNSDIGLKHDGNTYSPPATLDYATINSYDSDAWADVMSLAAGAGADFVALWQVPATAGNEIQGDSVSFDVTFILGDCGSGGGGVASWKTMASGTAHHLEDVWGSSGSDVFVVGHNGDILHYDGSAWTSMASGTNKKFYGVWGSSASDVYAVGYKGYTLHYDGSSWSQLSTGADKALYSVWGSGASDVYTVGDKGRIYHYDGSSWSLLSSGTNKKLYDVWGSSATDIFAVGYQGTIIHYDGSSWSAMSSGVNKHLDSVWGFSATDVYASGHNGIILHYDGASWTAMTSGSSHHLEALWGNATDDVMVAGDHGTILNYDGSSWSAMTSGTTRHLEGIWGFSSTDVFTVGNNGTILHYTTD